MSKRTFWIIIAVTLMGLLGVLQSDNSNHEGIWIWVTAMGFNVAAVFKDDKGAGA